MKRPLSHVCAVFIFAMFIAVTVFGLLRGVRDISLILLAVACAIQLLGMFVAPRDRRQYLVGTLLLTLIAMDAFYDLAFRPGYQLYTHVPGTRATWTIVAGNAIAAGILFLLAYDYAFGKESRRFFATQEKK